MNDTIQEKCISDLSDEKRNKIELLKDKFKSLFKEEPLFYSRAPGRVNLIGEHIDYCGYSVLPMAIDHDVIMAVSLNNSEDIHLTNFEENYPDFKVKISDISIDKSKPKWHDYFLSGMKGIMDKFDLASPTGMNICLYGQVPKSAGLSSSSALVVCSALATVFANKLQLNKTQLAEICAVAEQYVGTIGGGMDQAISCLGESGAALLIDFNPLRSKKVNLPDNSMFVITNSCVEANKAASNHFNTRVVECRLASQLLAKSQGLEWRKIKKPIEIQKILDLNFLELIDIVKANIHEGVYTLDEICQTLEATKEEIILNSLSQNTAEVREFRLFDRIMHVFSEAQRVYDFRDTCEMPSDKAFTQLGKLMNESHFSCKDKYQCSCAELDELTEICRKAGAYGSRLTGAGWGGCAVSLIPKEKLESFLSTIKANYYDKNEKLMTAYQTSAFCTKPSEGVFIVTN